MSVDTTADEKIRAAKHAVQDAIEALGEVVVDKCWGYDDYNKEYLREIEEIFQELISIRRRLN